MTRHRKGRAVSGMDYLKTALLYVPLQNQNWSMQINITDPLPLTP